MFSSVVEKADADWVSAGLDGVSVGVGTGTAGATIGVSISMMSFAKSNEL
jgi:hypothetical protein